MSDLDDVTFLAIACEVPQCIISSISQLNGVR
jgi:hypothetical protein